jgi:3-hydroxyacyl-[acyl-carrier-protein] dehydratase
MPSEPILDPATIDHYEIVEDREGIRRRNAQRFEFELLDAITYVDDARHIYAGYHDVKPDAWWARGHIPGRPLFPGVLQIEVAAQLASYLTCRLQSVGHEQVFLGFVGVDKVKFRSPIVPPARFVIVGRAVKLSHRRTIMEAQGFVAGTMVFEGEITGMKL